MRIFDFKINPQRLGSIGFRDVDRSQVDPLPRFHFKSVGEDDGAMIRVAGNHLVGASGGQILEFHLALLITNPRFDGCGQS